MTDFKFVLFPHKAKGIGQNGLYCACFVFFVFSLFLFLYIAREIPPPKKKNVALENGWLVDDPFLPSFWVGGWKVTFQGRAVNLGGCIRWIQMAFVI